jgi:predicted transposase YbfD/YdcC
MPEAQAQAEREYDKVVEWLEHFEPVEDPRQQGKVWYPLDEVLLLCLLAVLAGAEAWTEIALFGKRKLEFLRRFAPFEKGTPGHDQLGDLFATLDAEQFQRCFIAWTASLTRLSPDIIAIDGKTMRRAYQEGGAQAAIHMVSAWASGQRLVLGQAKVADKSNEITAIPALLDLITIKGSVVTIDAMGCQKEIAAKIVEKEGDYVLALKGNQGTLREDVELFFSEQVASGFADAVVSRQTTLEKSHGRIETRVVTVVNGIDWLKERHEWTGLESIVMVESTREHVGRDKTEHETRFYISSLAADAKRLGEVIRCHWGIENSHHWVMDMVFREDECRIRTGNAPANFATINHIAGNLMRRAPGKESMRAKRRLAAWDDDYLESLIRAG